MIILNLILIIFTLYNLIFFLRLINIAFEKYVEKVSPNYRIYKVSELEIYKIKIPALKYLGIFTIWKLYGVDYCMYYTIPSFDTEEDAKLFMDDLVRKKKEQQELRRKHRHLKRVK